MDLIPLPPIPRADQVVSAAGNVARTALYGGLADLRRMPRTLVAEGPFRELHHYRPATSRTSGDPVLLVMPLAAPSSCYDLRRGCSLVQHLVTGGRPTYLVEYGEVSLKDRSLGLDVWVEDVVPTAIRDTSAHAGGRPVHLVAWSLGGIFSLLAAADEPDLPIASITVLGSPVDTSLVPLVAPYRPLGEAPSLLTRWAFRVVPVQKLVAKPLAVATHLDDAEYLAQIEAVGRFAEGATAYPGRTYGQLYHRFLTGNALVDGSLEVGGRTVDLAAVTAPVLVLAGATDTIAPVPAVKAVVPLLTGSPDVRFEIVPGGHLGLLTGREARETTWPTLDDWISEWTRDVVAPATPPPPATRRTRAAQAVSATRPADPDAIGANPSRRYGSSGSRDLAR